MKKIIKKYWLLIVLGLTAGSIAAIVLSKPAPPTLTPLPTPPPRLNPTLPPTMQPSLTISYTGAAIDIPGRIPIYSNQPRPDDFTDLVNKITSVLKLNQSPENPSLWSSPDQTKYLTVSSDQTVISFGDTSVSDAGNRNILLDQAVSAATQWLDSINYPAQLDQNSPEFFIAAPGESIPVPQEEAEIIDLKFNAAIGGYPVYIGASPSSAASITITQNYRISKAILTPISLNINKIGDSPATTFSQLVSLLESGRAETLIIPSLLYTRPKNLPPTPVNITSATIHYRLLPDSQLLYPYILFEGKAQISPSSSQNYTSFILPLVNPQSETP